ncbi:MAG: hypothetical protein ACE10D_12780, partial [Planctomycetota bacterium]
GIASAQDAKPNILVIWGDDIGQGNISAYTKGVMGYRTPNIDRVANAPEGRELRARSGHGETQRGPWWLV